MALRLPPLSSLRVFEAAARHKSFRKAADELNLTASAVSHGIQTLENWLGVELFARAPRGLRLTSAGQVYAPLVNQALSVLAKATDQLPGRKATGTLSLSCAPTFASHILLPRLEKFLSLHPDVRLTVDTSHRMVDLTLDEFDIAVRYSPTEQPAANCTLLMPETLQPVCSPALRQQYGALDARLLSSAPLVHVMTAPSDWHYWFRATSVPEPASIDAGLRFDTIHLAMDAAKRGLGIVLGRSPLVDEDIAHGALVPLAVEPIASGSGYWLITSPTEFQKPEVKAFQNWIASELRGGGKHRKSARSVAPIAQATAS
jgi:LysR family transcriptional regulator, glycine cleavage system transcriptional activator